MDDLRRVSKEESRVRQRYLDMKGAVIVRVDSRIRMIGYTDRIGWKLIRRDDAPREAPRDASSTTSLRTNYNASKFDHMKILIALACKMCSKQKFSGRQ